MGKGTSTNTVVQNSQPPAAVLSAYQNVYNQAQNVAGQPLNPYPTGGAGAPNLVAPFTQAQKWGMGEIANLQGPSQSNPYVNRASNEIRTLLNNPIGSGIPQFDISNLPTQGLGNYGTATGLGGYAAGIGANMATAASPYVNAVGGLSSGLTGAVSPYVSQAGNLASALPGAVSSGIDTAQGLGAALPGAVASGIGTAQNAANAITGGGVPGYSSLDTYLSPYTSQVTGSLQSLFNQQNAQQQSEVAGNAAASGAWGGDRAAVAQALTAGQQQLTEAPELAQVEQQGFQQAQSELNAQQQLALSGLTAQGQLGLGAAGATTGAYGTAGQLGLGAAGATTGAYGTAGQLGLGAAGATTGAYGTAGQLGLGAGQLNLGQLQGAASTELAATQPYLAAAQGQLGEYNAEQQLQLGAQEAQGWLGEGSVYALGSLGQEQQNLALTGANAELGIGGLQQALAQQQLNVPYEQYIQQQAYPFQTTGWLSNIAEGIGGQMGGTATTQYPPPSAVSQIAGLGLTGAGTLGITGAFGNSGWLTGANGLLGGLGGGAAAAGAGLGAAGLTAADLGAAGGATSVGGLLGAGLLPLVKRGGRIEHRQEGGALSSYPGAPLYQSPQAQSPTGAQVPNLATSFVPSPPLQAGRGMGPPQMQPPSGVTPPGQASPILQGLHTLQTASGLEKLFPAGQALGGAVVPQPMPLHLQTGGAALPGVAGAGLGTMATPQVSPMQMALLRQYANLPTERLQELSAELPPTTPQGQAIARALQLKHMAPGASAPIYPSPPIPPTMGGLGAPPSPGVAAPGAPGTAALAARGGRMLLQDGGGPDAGDGAGQEIPLDNPPAPSAPPQQPATVVMTPDAASAPSLIPSGATSGQATPLGSGTSAYSPSADTRVTAVRPSISVPSTLPPGGGLYHPAGTPPGYLALRHGIFPHHAPESVPAGTPGAGPVVTNQDVQEAMRRGVDIPSTEMVFGRGRVMPPGRGLTAEQAYAQWPWLSHAPHDAGLSMPPGTARGPGGEMVQNPPPPASGTLSAPAADLVKHYESGNRYYVGVGGTDLSHADLDPSGFPIWGGHRDPQTGRISHAAGGYQFEPDEWRRYAVPLGIHDFSPQSQDAVFQAASAHEGLKPWLPYDRPLREAVMRGALSPFADVGSDQGADSPFPGGIGTARNPAFIGALSNAPPSAAGAPSGELGDIDAYTQRIEDILDRAEKPTSGEGVMQSPWMGVLGMGLGMLASRSPYPGVALGEGGLRGLQMYEQGQAEAPKIQAERLGAAEKAMQLAQAQLYMKELSRANLGQPGTPAASASPAGGTTSPTTAAGTPIPIMPAAAAMASGAGGGQPAASAIPADLQTQVQKLNMAGNLALIRGDVGTYQRAQQEIAAIMTGTPAYRGAVHGAEVGAGVGPETQLAANKARIEAQTAGPIEAARENARLGPETQLAANKARIDTQAAIQKAYGTLGPEVTRTLMSEAARVRLGHVGDVPITGFQALPTEVQQTVTGLIHNLVPGASIAPSPTGVRISPAAAPAAGAPAAMPAPPEHVTSAPFETPPDLPPDPALTSAEGRIVQQPGGGVAIAPTLPGIRDVEKAAGVTAQKEANKVPELTEAKAALDLQHEELVAAASPGNFLAPGAFPNLRERIATLADTFNKQMGTHIPVNQEQLATLDSVNKFAFQLSTGAVRAISARPAQIEWQGAQKSVPNSELAPFSALVLSNTLRLQNDYQRGQANYIYNQWHRGVAPNQAAEAFRQTNGDSIAPAALAGTWIDWSRARPDEPLSRQVQWLLRSTPADVKQRIATFNAKFAPLQGSDGVNSAAWGVSNWASLILQQAGWGR